MACRLPLRQQLVLCRDALDQVVERTLAPVHFLKVQGATATHNMDKQKGELTKVPLRPCRDALDQVVERTLALVHFLKAQGATATHNMDNLLLRESMDVIGAQAFWNPAPLCMYFMQS